MPVTCGDRTLLLQPRQVAAALRASLDESRLGTPHYWDVAATEHGEWWALRARYPMPPGRETAAGPAETCITVQCAVDGTRLLLQPACRLPQSGAEIQSSEYDVTIDDLRVRLPHNPGFDLLTAVADEVDATADLLASLRTEAVSRRMLVAWASAMVKPAMGHTMATTLIALYDQRRFSTSLPDRNRPDPVDTARDIAWTLARQTCAVRNIDARTALQSEIIHMVSELALWTRPPVEVGRDLGHGLIDRVH